MKVLCINFEPDFSYYTKRGLNIETKVINVNLPKFPSLKVATKPGNNGQVVDFYTPFPHEYLNNTYKKFEYSAILVGYKPSDYGPEFANTGGYSHWKDIDSGIYWATVKMDGNEKLYATHELQHIICSIINIKFKDYTPKDYMDATPVNGVMVPYYKNDTPEAPDGNYAYTWNLCKKFVPQLNSIQYVTKYKYFSQAEVNKYKLDPKLWSLLDKIREDCKFPIILTSGLRTKEENDKLPNAVEDSAHINGLAADISITDSTKRYQLIDSAKKYGITRFGIGKSFIHVDIDTTKPQNVMWLYA